MAQWTVNDRQLEVLTWIGAGCPEGVMVGDSHKTTAVALQSRRLAKVTRKRGVWGAVITHAGSHVLEHGEYPDGHWPVPVRVPSPGETEPPRRPSRAPAGQKATGRRPVDQMIADVVAAGGRLTVAVGPGRRWESLVSSATRYGKVPEGKTLAVERGSTYSEQVLVLADTPEWMTTVLAPVPVQAHLRRPHPVVAGVRDNRDQLDMKRDTRQRALRLLDAVAKEVDRRGYHVSAPTPAPGYARAKGLLVLTITGHNLALDVDELKDRIPHEATAKELREKERYSWTRIPTHDAVPSGRLRMRILDGWPIHQDTFSDTKTVALDDRLPRLLQEMELRAAAFEERRLQHEREEAARRVRWERALEEAKVQAREHHRADLLVRQVRDWQGAKAIAAYLDAMTEHIAILTGEPRINAEAWLAWANEYRARLDPLGQELGLPPDPAFTPEALRPFMGGHSPY